MNGFLVISRHNLDDFPLALFDRREQAEGYARSIAEKGGPDKVPLAVWDISGFIKTEVVRFEDGRPIEVVAVFRADEFGTKGRRRR